MDDTAKSLVDQIVEQVRKPKPTLRETNHPIGCNEKATRCQKCTRRLKAAKMAKVARRKNRNVVLHA